MTVEIDGYPDRQDLSRELLAIAKQSGVRISLGSDAHHGSQLHYLDYSLAAALSASISAKRIINFMPVDELRSWVAKSAHTLTEGSPQHDLTIVILP